ncbi:hypothetical protein [Natrinema altunense]|nr:hypothetical protein [Natrinema altunense]
MAPSVRLERQPARPTEKGRSSDRQRRVAKTMLSVTAPSAVRVP